jgi:hypothetical protein
VWLRKKVETSRKVVQEEKGLFDDLVAHGAGRLCCLKLIEERPGGKLDKLIVRYISDGTRERGLDIEHGKLVPQGKLAYLGPIFKLIPSKPGILGEHPARREFPEGAAG